MRRVFRCVSPDLFASEKINHLKMQLELNKSPTCIQTRTRSKTKTNLAKISKKTSTNVTAFSFFSLKIVAIVDLCSRSYCK